MDLISRLPMETHGQILREFDPIDLVSFALTCTYAFASTRFFMNLAYTHYKILMPFLRSRRGVEEFVELMSRTSMVISGSQAIAFLYRLRYSESDLDLYVGSKRHMGAVEEIVTFLMRYGYQVIKENIQHSIQHPDFIRKWKPFANATTGRTFVMRTDEYSPSNIVRVIHLKFGNRVIQIIVPAHNIMDAILSFHSTVVMNVITATHAYCLYARASLVEKVNIIRKGPYDNDHVSTAIDKYEHRGFAPVDVGESDWIIDYRDDMRRVGDRYCWSVPLSSGAKYLAKYLEEEDALPPMECNTWQLVCNFSQLQPDFHFHHAAYETGDSADAMCVADDMLIALDAPPSVWIVNYIKKMKETKESTDDGQMEIV
ncbi:hypothetical protein BDZ89DRAFT_1036738 [Hymenopellis radicata]|nr:hypothetical protein BDZ89DRAFT_1036738 [Hymenopellis radicata]